MHATCARANSCQRYARTVLSSVRVRILRKGCHQVDFCAVAAEIAPCQVLIDERTAISVRRQRIMHRQQVLPAAARLRTSWTAPIRPVVRHDVRCGFATPNEGYSPGHRINRVTMWQRQRRCASHCPLHQARQRPDSPHSVPPPISTPMSHSGDNHGDTAAMPEFILRLSSSVDESIGCTRPARSG